MTVANGTAQLGDDWDDLVAHCPFAQRDWLRVTEQTMRGYDPRYLVVRLGGRPVGAVVSARQRHFNTSAYVSNERLLPWAVRALNVFPPLSVQVAPFGYSGIILAGDIAPDKRADATAVILRALDSVALRSRAPFVGINNIPGELDAYRAEGYSVFPTNDEAILDVEHRSYAEYEQALPKKYREEVRRVRNRAFRSGVTLDYPEADRLPTEDIERLMRAVTAKHNNTFPYQPGFIEVARPSLRPDRVRLVNAWLDGSLVATLGVFATAGVATFRWFGMDYERARDAHAYHLIMSEGVAQAIELGVRQIQLGATSYVVKKKLGARREPRYIAARPATRLAGRAVQLALGQSAWGQSARGRTASHRPDST